MSGQATSLLAAAMDDAAAAIRANALWLGTLGYLIVIEQMGHWLQRKTPRPRAEGGATDSFTAFAAEFGAPSLTAGDRRLLYGVRCALAHQFGLTQPKLEFAYTRGDKSSVFPDPTSRPVIVCLDAIWNYVIDLDNNVRTEHANGNVMLLKNKSAGELLRMSFEVR